MGPGPFKLGVSSFSDGVTNWPYLSEHVKKWKSEDTLFSQTFKVEETKVPSLFFIFDYLTEISGVYGMGIDIMSKKSKCPNFDQDMDIL